jgi:hypothetical protein
MQATITGASRPVAPRLTSSGLFRHISFTIIAGIIVAPLQNSTVTDTPSRVDRESQIKPTHLNCDQVDNGGDALRHDREQ